LAQSIRTILVSAFLVILAVGLTACGEKAGDQQAQEPQAQQATPAAVPSQAAANAWTGEVLETMNSGGYTYVHLDTGTEKIWAAGPETETEINVGQKVTMGKGMPMQNFHSKTLERDFSVIYFVGAIEDANHAHAAPGGQDSKPAMGQDAPISGTKIAVEDAGVEGVTKIAGGYTVAEIFAKRNDLKDQEVKVRARVVKFTPNIMGTNWIHIQDGTGDETTRDLTVTSSATAAVGDLVVIQGPLSVDRDFGAGYRYSAIIEGATVTTE